VRPQIVQRLVAAIAEGLQTRPEAPAAAEIDFPV
jgi:hypothetical protein